MFSTSVRAMTAELDPGAASCAPVRSCVDPFRHEAGAQPERSEAPPVEGLTQGGGGRRHAMRAYQDWSRLARRATAQAAYFASFLIVPKQPLTQ